MTVEHHPWGPSTLARRKLCPGSYKMESRFGLTEAPSDHAAQGERLHRGQASTPEEEELVKTAEQFAAEICEANDVIQHQREVCVRLHDDNGQLLFWGWADYLGFSDDDVIGIDWKFGRIKRELSTDLQCRMYAAAVVEQFERPCKYYLFNPRWGCEGLLELQPEGLSEIRAEFLDIQARASGDRLELVPEPEACEFCSAKAACPAVALLSQEIVEAEPFSLMPPERLQTLASQVTTVERAAKLLRDYIRKNVDEFPDWRLEKRKAPEYVTSTSQAIARLRDHLLPAQLDELLETVGSISLSKLRKADPESAELLKDLIDRGPMREALCYRPNQQKG